MTDEIRQTIRLNKYTTTIVREKAASTWPELEGNNNGLVNKIIADWDRVREGSGGRTSQLSKRIDDHEHILHLICDRLGIEWTK